jgi:hypothetical protein
MMHCPLIALLATSRGDKGHARKRRISEPTLRAVRMNRQQKIHRPGD